MSVFNGVKDTKNRTFLKYYPTQDLVTGPDIIFFWVARMIMAGYYFSDQAPFKKVYFTGIVRDKRRRKMSKSLGNSPDPLKLIETYGADSVRMAMMLCARAGNDVLFDAKLCLQGRNFSNKLWNAYRLCKSWQCVEDTPTPIEQQASKIFEAQLQHALQKLENYYEDFKIADVALTLYKLVCEDFCNIYLELIKYSYKQKNKLSVTSYSICTKFFEILVKLLHPFMPFITEEIFQHISPQKHSIMLTDYPKPLPYTASLVQNIEQIQTLIQKIRQYITSLPNIDKQQIHLYIQARNVAEISPHREIMASLLNFKVEHVHINKKDLSALPYFRVNTTLCLLEVAGKSVSKHHETDKAKLREECMHHINYRHKISRQLMFNANTKATAKARKKMEDGFEIINLLISHGASVSAKDLEQIESENQKINDLIKLRENILQPETLDFIKQQQKKLSEAIKTITRSSS